MTRSDDEYVELSAAVEAGDYEVGGDAADLARTFHTALLENPDCVAWEWHELSDEHRAWKTKAAQRVIEAGWMKRDAESS